MLCPLCHTAEERLEVGWSFGLWVSANKDTALRAQVLAVVFAHFILSGILALEANMLM